MFKDVREAVAKAIEDLEEVLMDINEVEEKIDTEDPCFVEFYQDVHNSVLASHVNVAQTLITEIKRNRVRRRQILDEITKESQEMGLYDLEEEDRAAE